jgi:hypothetical protein
VPDRGPARSTCETARAGSAASRFRRTTSSLWRPEQRGRGLTGELEFTVQSDDNHPFCRVTCVDSSCVFRRRLMSDGNATSRAIPM